MWLFDKIDEFGDFIGDVLGETGKAFKGAVDFVFDAAEEVGNFVVDNWEWIALAGAAYLTAGAILGVGAGPGGSFSWLGGLNKVNAALGMPTAWGESVTHSMRMTTYAGPATQAGNTAQLTNAVRPTVAKSAASAAPAAASSAVPAVSPAVHQASTATPVRPQPHYGLLSSTPETAQAANPYLQGLGVQAAIQGGGAIIEGVGDYLSQKSADEAAKEAAEEERKRMAYAPMNYGLLQPNTLPKVRPQTVDDLIAARSNRHV